MHKEGLLEALAAQAPAPTVTDCSVSVADGKFVLKDWIASHCDDAKDPKDTPTGRVWELPECPWNSDHKGSAYIMQLKKGGISAGCHHNSCRDKGWHDLRDVKEPGWRERRQKSTDSDKTRVNAAKKRGSVNVSAYRCFPVDMLPEPIRGTANAIAAATGADPAFAALPLLAACAGAIGSSRRLRVRRGWDVPAILWMASVGESGTGKSPPLAIAVRSVKKREARLFRDHQRALEDYEKDKLLYEKAVLDWKKARSKGDDPPEKPQPPIGERVFVGDTTLEALGPILLQNPRGLLLCRDELGGWFGSFDRYATKARASSDAAQWLSIFDGDSISIDRKTGGERIYVPHAAISICGGIQPAILRKALSEEYRQNGLAARWLFAYPTRRLRQWTDADVAPEVERSLAGLLDHLFGLQLDVDDDGDLCPVVIELTRDAKRRYVRFFNQHNERGIEFTGDVAAAWSKLEQYPLRLALVTHLVRVAAGDPRADAMQVDDLSMAAGIELGQWFAFESQRIYDVLDESLVDQEARQLVELIRRRGGTATVRDLMRSSRRFRTAADAESALEDLVKEQLGVWSPIETGDQGGRPTREFRLNQGADIDTTPESLGNGGSVNVNATGESAVDFLNAELSQLAADESGGDGWTY